MMSKKEEYQYQPDIGDGKFLIRVRNIAEAYKSAFNHHTKGQKHIVKRHLRDHITKGFSHLIVSAKGDDRVTGDACGGKGLKLEIDGRGMAGKILLNKNNLMKCLDWLDAQDNANPEEFRF